MWPFKNKEANQDQAKTPVSPTMPPALPVAKFDPKINASFDLTRLAEYGRLAREVEYFPNEVVEQLFLHTLKKLGIKLFSLDEVRSYLSASYGREGYTGFWSWRTLHKPELQYVCDEYSYVYRRCSRDGDFLRGISYDLPLPLSVLKLASSLSREIPGLKFFVSCPERGQEVRAYSFLLAEAGRYIYVICSWEKVGPGL